MSFMTGLRGGVVAVLAGSCLCGQSRVWVDRSDRPMDAFFPHGNTDGGPAILRDGQLFGRDGAGWQRLPPLPTDVLHTPAVVFDRARGELLALLERPLGIETWVLGGSGAWTLRANAPPRIRGAHFDPARTTPLAFTTDYATNTTQDFAWDGAQWQPLPPNRRPAELADVVAVDFGRRRLVAIGDATMARAGETWEWDGAVWTQRSPANAPPPRVTFAFAHDPTTQRVVLFGGFDATTNTLLADTWDWDGTNWTQRAPATTPQAGRFSALGYDRGRDRLTLFAMPGTADHAWTGADWVPGPTTPDGSITTSVGDDPLRGVVVVRTDDATYEWDGVRWTATPGAGPGPFNPIAYDLVGGTSVLFGASTRVAVAAKTFQRVFTNETWTWDGATWTQSTPPVAPPPRHGHALMTHTGSASVILFGGLDPADAALADTWTYANGTWTDRTPTLVASPPGGRVHGANVPLPRDPMLLARDEVWRWSGQWTRVGPAVPAFAPFWLGMLDDGTPVVASRPSGAGPNVTHELRAGAWQPQGAAPRLFDGVARDPLRGTLIGTAHGSRFAYTDLPGEEVAVGAGCGAFVPWLGGEGHPRPGNVDYALGAGVTANAPVLFAMDFAPAAIPLGGGCTQNLATPVGIGWRLASQNGVARLPVPLPLQPALRGLTAFAQIATLQPGGPLGGVALSAGLRIRVGD